MTFLNTSLRRSLEKFWLAILVNTPHMIPKKPPRITVRIMRIPVEMIRCISPTPPVDRPSTPSSTMVLIS